MGVDFKTMLVSRAVAASAYEVIKSMCTNLVKSATGNYLT